MTDTKRFQHVAELFEAARSREGDDRDTFLRTACADDPELLDEIRRLFAHHEAQDAPLDKPVIPDEVRLDLFPSITSPPLPDRIGRYLIRCQLGIGGMGVVYLAEQAHPQRQVAVKVVRPGLVNRDLLRRFELETTALGRLQHPGIAQIYEAGTFDDGTGPRPFFAMELVDGKPLTEYAASHELDTRQRLALFTGVCSAVHHAHQRGIIHRDIKPSNILVDATGQPKVLDFGIARATDSDLQITTLQTDASQLIGTLPYMSPEQIAGDAGEVDVRSDVYALGVTLYELLTGTLPYNLANSTLIHAARIVTETEPTPLSEINRVFRGDLNTIVLKALAKDPGRRYQAASDLEADIHRFLANEPIIARPTTTIYQLRKFTARHRGLTAGVAVATLALIVGTVVATTLAIGQTRAQREANRRADDLERVAAFQAAQLYDLDPNAMGELLRDDLLKQLRTSFEADGIPPEQSDQQLDDLQTTLDRVNFTDIALGSLDANIFSRAITAADTEFADQPLVEAEILQSLASTMRDLGLLDQAVSPQEKALNVRREHLGNDDPKTLQSIDTTGLLYKHLGRFKEAGELYREALEGRRRVLGNGHLDTLVSMINKGLLFKSMDRLPEAEALFREAHSTSQRSHGDTHWMTLHAATNIGIAVEAQGRYAEAFEYYDLSLRGRRELLGDEHPDTLAALNNMGTVLVRLGRLDEAEPFFTEAFETRRRVLGASHPSTLVSMSNMAAILRRQGRLDEAEPYYRRTLQIRRETLGDSHPSTLLSINNMASFLALKGDLDAAIDHYFQVWDGARDLFGPSHAQTLRAAQGLGVTLQRRERMSEAEQVFLEACNAARTGRGESDAETVALMRLLVALYKDWHDADPAAGHDQSELEWQRRIDALPPATPNAG